MDFNEMPASPTMSLSADLFKAGKRTHSTHRSASSERSLLIRKLAEMSYQMLQAQAMILEQTFYQEGDSQIAVTSHDFFSTDSDSAVPLATATVERKILEELLNAEITPKTLMAFSLFPAIHVAWANGRISESEKQAILESARKLGVAPASPAFVLMESWLSREPNDQLFEAWKQFVQAVRPAISADAFQQLQDAAICRAKSMADSSGAPRRIRDGVQAEAESISELEAVFKSAVLKQLPPEEAS